MADLDLITTDSRTIYLETIAALENELNEPLYPGDERRMFAEALNAFITSYQNTSNAHFKQRFMQ